MLTKYPLWVLTNLCASSFFSASDIFILTRIASSLVSFPDKKQIVLLALHKPDITQCKFYTLTPCLQFYLGNFLSCLFCSSSICGSSSSSRCALRIKRTDDTPMTETPDHPYSIQTQCNIPCSTFSDTMQPQIHSLPAYRYQ